MNPIRKRAYIELLFVAIIWAWAAPVIKYTLGGFSPAVFLTYRFFISSLAAIPLFIITGLHIPKNPKTLLLVLFNGFLISTAALGLLFLGIAKTSSFDANIISAMAPITVAIAGVIFLKERITKREAVGILIALAGTFLTIVGPSIQDGFSGLIGNLLVFASVLVTTATAVFAKKVMREDVDPIFATNASFIVGLITMLPFSLSQIINSKFQIITSVPFTFHIGVLYMGLLSGTVAYILWHRAEKSIEISEVNLLTYLYPVFGTPLSVFWLKEKITLPVAIGLIIIALGVFLAEYKNSKRIKKN